MVLGLGVGWGREMVGGIRILSFGISINAFLFSSYHLYSLCCLVSPSLEYLFSMFLEDKFPFSHQGWSVCTQLLAVCVQDQERESTIIHRLSSYLFTLCFPSTHLVLPRCGPFPGSWRGELTFLISIPLRLQHLSP